MKALRAIRRAVESLKLCGFVALWLCGLVTVARGPALAPVLALALALALALLGKARAKSF